MEQFPLVSFRFKVIVDEPKSQTPKFLGVFETFSGIKMSTTQLRHSRSITDKSNVLTTEPTFMKFDTVVFSAGIIDGNYFFDWVNNVTPMVQGISVTPGVLRRDIWVSALNEHGEVGFTWILKKCIPVGYTLAPFDSLQSELCAESLEFGIAGVERVNKQQEISKRIAR